ncbi:hypothetical protein OS188_11065 [Xanthomarina sp. F1114]|uniref:DUF4870 domain-containing protein n=1 Tax=Xanthomarina sp. F1114 TaxID=2996019 RepID=UPI00225DF504|nr:hypothetical protein [Xanthomarina sp. F1114]MCX7548490.1 hypothetical protein [Xanthomarina sp. F1114]
MSVENNNFEDDLYNETSKFSHDILKDGKTIAIIAHMTIIGWIIAYFMNRKNKNAYASFYIRQALGIMLGILIVSFIPVIGWVLGMAFFILWILSLVGSLSGEIKHIPFFGNRFQEWFIIF